MSLLAQLPELLSVETLKSIYAQAEAHPYPLTSPIVPLATAAIYLIAIEFIQPTVAQAKAYTVAALAAKAEQKAKKLPKTRALADWLIILHNVILCVFSVITFAYTFPVMLADYQTGGTLKALCGGHSSQIMVTAHYAFYLSKYYEIFDTVILLYKGQRPIILSKYHHAGAILIMWLLVVTKAPACWIFTVFNSFIHSGMYLYYIATLLDYRFPFKPLITLAQLTQFFVGTYTAYQYFSLTAACKGTVTTENKFATLMTLTYVVTLIVLFSNFFLQQYVFKSSSKSAGVKKVQ